VTVEATGSPVKRDRIAFLDVSSRMHVGWGPKIFETHHEDPVGLEESTHPTSSQQGASCMTPLDPVRPSCCRLASQRWLLLVLAVPVLAALGFLLAGTSPVSVARPSDSGTERRVKAPELEGGVAWLNTAGPIKLEDLRGKVVLL